MGKIALGLKVTDGAGQRIGVEQSLGWTLEKAMSRLFFGAVYLIISNHERSQTLHDRLTKTLVLSK